MTAAAGLCPSCSAALGQPGAVAPTTMGGPANAGVEIPPRPEPSQVAKYVATAIAAAMVVGVAIWLAFARGGASEEANVSEESYAADYADQFLSDSDETLFVTGAANARSLPTTEGTEILRSYAAGDRIEGRWVRGKDRTTRWLRVDGEGRIGYVWEGNLSGDAPSATLDRVISFRDLGNCEASASLSRIYDEMLSIDYIDGGIDARTSAEIHLGDGLSSISPRLSRTPIEFHVPGAERVEAALRFPDNTKWHGLTISSVAVQLLYYPDTDSQDRKVLNFRDSPMRVREVLSGLGVSVPLSPQYAPLEDGACGGSMSIERTLGGAALVCSYGC